MKKYIFFACTLIALTSLQAMRDLSIKSQILPKFNILDHVLTQPTYVQAVMAYQRPFIDQNVKQCEKLQKAKAYIIKILSTAFDKTVEEVDGDLEGFNENYKIDYTNINNQIEKNY